MCLNLKDVLVASSGIVCVTCRIIKVGRERRAYFHIFLVVDN